MIEDIVYSHGLPDALRAEAAILLDEAFGAKLALGIPDRATRIRVLAQAARPECALCALTGHALVGLAGFRTRQAGLTSDATARWLRARLGLVRGLRAAFVFGLERPPAADVLLLEFLAVRPDMRGRGIGGQLLELLDGYAREQGYPRVRLDVIEANPARRLYERSGFVPVRTVRFPYLRWLLGFGAFTTMERPVANRASPTADPAARTATTASSTAAAARESPETAPGR